MLQRKKKNQQQSIKHTWEFIHSTNRALLEIISKILKFVTCNQLIL